MKMSSIKKKRLLCPFDLLGLVIFVGTNVNALLILSWKVLVTRPSALYLAAKSLGKINRRSTVTRSDHSPWLLEKSLAYQNHPKKLSTTYPIIQEPCNRCCFFAVLNISIGGFFMARSRQLFNHFHFPLVWALVGLQFPPFYPCNFYSKITSKLDYARPCFLTDKKSLIDIFCVRIKPVYQNPNLQPNLLLQHHTRGA